MSAAKKPAAAAAAAESTPVPSSPVPLFFLTGSTSVGLIKVLSSSYLSTSDSALHPLRSPAVLQQLKAIPLPPGSSAASDGIVLLSAATGSVCLGANSAARSFHSGRGGVYDGGEVDEWLSWEESTLSPAAASFRSGHKDGEKQLSSALSSLASRLTQCGGETVCPRFATTGGSGLGGGSSSATVADLCIAATLHPLVPHSPMLGPSGSPALFSYLNRLTSSNAYKQALSSCGPFATPSPLTPSPFADPLSDCVSHLFLSAVHAAFPAVLAATFPELKVVASRVTAKGVSGDYQCTSALEVHNHFKVLSASRSALQSAGLAVPPLPAGFEFPKNPRDCALKIAAAIDVHGPLLAGAPPPTVAGAGYVNITLSESFLKTRVCDILSGGVKAPAQKKKLKVAVDFSSPNIAKEMHVGHLRSTIIGESVCRILEFAGHSVERINHVGDWGTQFGMLIEYLKDTRSTGGAAEANISDLTNFYKAAKAKFDEDEDFKGRSQRSVVSLQSGDKECLAMWQTLCDTSRKEFKKVYDRLGVVVHEYGESFYNSRIPATNAELADRGLVSDSNGAQCIFVPGFGFPLMIRKSDGGFGYDSTDMAALSYRLREMKADRIVYITDFSQGEHFKLCFEAAAMAGWWNETSHQLQHIGFGTVNGDDGKRFKTRSGTTVRLVDLLDEACTRMEKSLKERAAEGKGADFSEEELKETAAKIGYGAVKYFDLSKNPTSNYIFNFDNMLDTKGNTGVYQMFAQARLASIIDKGKASHGVDVAALVSGLPGTMSLLTLSHPAERALAFEVLQFLDMLDNVIRDLSPNKICDYLYDLAAKATTFVTDCRVLGSDEMRGRLLLCEVTAMIMRKCFDLLGMGIPARV